MLSKTMQDALNDQINAEYYSSYLYLSMAAWAESASLKGFANWFRVQVQEENFHAMKFFQYVLDRRGVVKLAAIAGPPTQWASPLAAFEATLAHEQHVTGRINKLADLAIKENDHASHALLEWFVNEQVEEEAAADLILQQLKLAGDAPAALFILDRELGARVYTPPAAGV
jgi:ferritin